ncbi:MAG: hypothetical protein D6830_02520 [Ignavibacteria bacterium]|nr:MAG: hypothetical protein D6830_02520 [Ignavibacteria bacterium]
MNKILLQVGLLFFFLSLIFFSQLGLPIIDVVVRSFIVFIALMVMLSVFTIIFIRSINKSISDKSSLENNLSGKSS